MNETDVNVLLKFDLFNHVVLLSLVALLSKENNKKKVFKLARKIQRNSTCKSTRSVMERICQYKGESDIVVLETYKLLRSGKY